MTYIISISATGKAMFDIAGNCAIGMISITFITQMKKNSDTRNGR